ncbi:oligopeptide/dipeptide ABC transporter, ATP-binding protein, C-terminal domain protein [Archaeoglobus sulfaticallidus PM70-1]|uniref:Oligopeptide/dipeptide ABC transporter, ATP-binding protein, C-terminal domain protein n=1 Tax=Archaeoglobus sulfaticallidus PM70-1 TaxID=387631 RepID=N0BG08_9EURY|nr:ABC transporter ATP-binding protein [Archaeoglobus sulfaticallidus]AGK61237.1 oligopeptide/dipeptide ABC transporter, ATP-binding protein, C-terminal domain protein [Archaeoglobus sulfaticallidus PM70-1]
MKELLTINDLYVNFRTMWGTAKVLNGVSLKIRKEEIFGLIGETGCGKSVTAMSILRLQPSNAEVYGEIIFKGENILEKSEEEMRKIRGKDISVVFQDPMTSLNPLFKIKDQMVDVITTHEGLSKEESLRHAKKYLKSVGLADVERILNSYPHELSGGMRQRVLIAMALSSNPSLLIADEPTTALDVTIQKQILGLILELKESYGFSVLLITHDLGVVAEICDRAGVMYAGNVVEVANTEELFENTIHPYSKALLSVVPDPRRRKHLKPLKGSVPSLINPPDGCRFHPRCDCMKDACTKQKPELIEYSKDHFVACHLYGGAKQ